MFIKLLFLCIGFMLSLLSSEHYYAYGKKIELLKLDKSRTFNTKGLKYYLTPEGKQVGVKDKIILECKEQRSCEKNLEKYNFLHISKLSKKLFLITIQKHQNIFTILEKLYSDTHIKFSHPDFTKSITKR